MKIKWFGHSCFKITSDEGVSILTDPFDNSVGYKALKTNADIVTVSHDHYDHNYTKAVSGNYELINKTGMFYVKDININGIASYHDNNGGKERGNNIIYTYDLKGIKVCHLGDLGHILNDRQVHEIGGVDVLFIPIGGHFTIDAADAVYVVRQLKPSIVIPMHYKTAATPDFPIANENEFVSKMGSAQYAESDTITVDHDKLDGNTKVYVLNY